MLGMIGLLQAGTKYDSRKDGRERRMNMGIFTRTKGTDRLEEARAKNSDKTAKNAEKQQDALDKETQRACIKAEKKGVSTIGAIVAEYTADMKGQHVLLVFPDRVEVHHFQVSATVPVKGSQTIPMEKISSVSHSKNNMVFGTLTLHTSNAEIEVDGVGNGEAIKGIIENLL